MKLLHKYFPITNWISSYKLSTLKNDLPAGLSVGIVLIPQGIAYAIIADIPPIYGLYTALIPQLVYAIFGTSRQLSVGPVAMDSLLVAAGLSALSIVGIYLSKIFLEVKKRPRYSIKKVIDNSPL